MAAAKTIRSRFLMTGKLMLPSVAIGERTVFTATTEQLREFALEHAEDQDAFSEAFAFQRKK
jgi:hypothetical protein